VFTSSPQHHYYQATAKISVLRSAQPALRYGRQYFRQLTGDDVNFGYSPYPGGVLAYSRVLNDPEVVVVANTSQTSAAPVSVVVDHHIHQPGSSLSVLFSNLTLHGASAPAALGPIYLASGRALVRLTLRPMEGMVLR